MSRVRVGRVGVAGPVACGPSELYARACLVADLPGYRGHSPAEPRGRAVSRQSSVDTIHNQRNSLRDRTDSSSRLLTSLLPVPTAPSADDTLSISPALEGMSYSCNPPACDLDHNRNGFAIYRYTLVNLIRIILLRPAEGKGTRYYNNRHNKFNETLFEIKCKKIPQK